jgi:hypothetical protein
MDLLGNTEGGPCHLPRQRSLGFRVGGVEWRRDGKYQPTLIAIESSEDIARLRIRPIYPGVRSESSRSDIKPAMLIVNSGPQNYKSATNYIMSGVEATVVDGATFCTISKIVMEGPSWYAVVAGWRDTEVVMTMSREEKSGYWALYHRAREYPVCLYVIFTNIGHVFVTKEVFYGRNSRWSGLAITTVSETWLPPTPVTIGHVRMLVFSCLKSGKLLSISRAW